MKEMLKKSSSGKRAMMPNSNLDLQKRKEVKKKW